jgi:hypothetical protein
MRDDTVLLESGLEDKIQWPIMWSFTSKYKPRWIYLHFVTFRCDLDNGLPQMRVAKQPRSILRETSIAYRLVSKGISHASSHLLITRLHSGVSSTRPTQLPEILPHNHGETLNNNEHFRERTDALT